MYVICVRNPLLCKEENEMEKEGKKRKTPETYAWKMLEIIKNSENGTFCKENFLNQM